MLKSLKYVISFMLVFVCLYKVFIMFEISFYSVCGSTQYMWRSGGNFGELVPSFHLISPGGLNSGCQVWLQGPLSASCLTSPYLFSIHVYF